jgi:hypothetical protein
MMSWKRPLARGVIGFFVGGLFLLAVNFVAGWVPDSCASNPASNLVSAIRAAASLAPFLGFFIGWFG